MSRERPGCLRSKAGRKSVRQKHTDTRPCTCLYMHTQVHMYNPPIYICMLIIPKDP